MGVLDGRVAIVTAGGGEAPDHLHQECDRGAELELGRAVRTRGHFPGDDAAMKLPYLALNKAAHRRKVRHLMTITGPAHKIADSPSSDVLILNLGQFYRPSPRSA